MFRVADNSTGRKDESWLYRVHPLFAKWLQKTFTINRIRSIEKFQPAEGIAKPDGCQAMICRMILSEALSMATVLQKNHGFKTEGGVGGKSAQHADKKKKEVMQIRGNIYVSQMNSVQNHPSSLGFSSCDVSPILAFSSGRRCRGKKAKLAMSVGTTALPMTTATRKEYCPCVTMLWDKPYRDEIVPKVRPVDIKRV
jgi:hypothetical protein